MAVLTTGDMIREVAYRCQSSHLVLDCGPDGAFNTEVAVVGEYVGEREKATKLPLSGSGGKLFWELVRPLGITRRSAYCTTAIKRQVIIATTGPDKGKVKVHRHEADHYAALIQWELQQLPNLKYIICLGDYALQAVTGLSGIVQHRGSVYETVLRSASTDSNRECKVIAFLNPNDVTKIGGAKNEIIFKFDVGRLKSVMEGKFQYHDIKANIRPSYTEAMQWMDKLQDEKKPISFDIETISGETACFGFANDAHEGFCINLRDESKSVYSVAEETKIRLRLQALADGETTQWVMQNGMFDSSWLAFKDRLMLGPSYFDTMLAHHTLYPSFPHNLGFITTQYTTHPYYKDEGKAWKEGGTLDSFWEYNVKDACITFAAYEKMYKELDEQGLREFFFDHVMRLQPHLISMTVGGVLTDADLKSTIAADVAKEVSRVKAEFQQLAREATGDNELSVNPSSPKQLADLFFTKLRLVGRGTATDKKNRARMRAHPKTPQLAIQMLDALDKYAEENKFLGTYAEMEVDVDNRARCEYKQTGVAAAPGRLSSSSTMWGSGTNLQNQPGRAHKMFIADPGYGFSYFDLTQAEAQVVGHKARIEKWQEQYRLARQGSGFDAHRALASEMFDVPYDEVPKEDWDENGKMTIRYIAKRCRHGLNYRMGPDRLAEVLGIDMTRATELWNIYHNANPEIKRWWDATLEEVKNNRRLYNAYGRRWILLERYDEEALKSVVAYYPQSTIGDKVSRTIYMCHSDPDWPVGRARMALNIHDALISLHELDRGVTEAVQHVMKKHAEEPLLIKDIYGETRELIIAAELKQSVADSDGVHRWSNLEKVKYAA